MYLKLCPNYTLSRQHGSYVHVCVHSALKREKPAVTFVVLFMLRALITFFLFAAVRFPHSIDNARGWSCFLVHMSIVYKHMLT